MSEKKKSGMLNIIIMMVVGTAVFVMAAIAYKESLRQPVAKPLHTPLPDPTLATDAAAPAPDAAAPDAAAPATDTPK